MLTSRLLSNSLAAQGGGRAAAAAAAGFRRLGTAGGTGGSSTADALATGAAGVLSALTDRTPRLVDAACRMPRAAAFKLLPPPPASAGGRMPGDQEGQMKIHHAQASKTNWHRAHHCRLRTRRHDNAACSSRVLCCHTQGRLPARCRTRCLNPTPPCRQSEAMATTPWLPAPPLCREQARRSRWALIAGPTVDRRASAAAAAAMHGMLRMKHASARARVARVAPAREALTSKWMPRCPSDRPYSTGYHEQRRRCGI